MSDDQGANRIMSQAFLVHHATLSVLEKQADPKLLIDVFKVIVEVAKGERTLSEGQGQLGLSGLREKYEEQFGEGFEAWVAQQRQAERDSAKDLANAFAELFWGGQMPGDAPE